MAVLSAPLSRFAGVSRKPWARASPRRSLKLGNLSQFFIPLQGFAGSHSALQGNFFSQPRSPPPLTAHRVSASGLDQPPYPHPVPVSHLGSACRLLYGNFRSSTLGVTSPLGGRFRFHSLGAPPWGPFPRFQGGLSEEAAAVYLHHPHVQSHGRDKDRSRKAQILSCLPPEQVKSSQSSYPSRPCPNETDLRALG